MIGEAVIAGVLLPTTDQQDLDDKAGVWADFCGDVPYEFARGVVRAFPTGHNRFLTPNRLSNEWHDQQRSNRGPVTFDEAACAWARHCRCDHLACFHGQMREAEDKVTLYDAGRAGTKERITTGVRWCSRCWDARNIAREKAGKEARDYGDMQP